MTTYYVGSGGNNGNNGTTWALSMRSTFARYYSMNSGNWTIEQASKARLSPSAFIVQITHGLHIFICEAVIVMRLAKCRLTFLCVSGSRRLSTLANFVTHIISGAAKKQMGRIATRSIITGMTDQHPIWDCANRYLISIAVRVCLLLVHNRETPIAILIYPSKIGPAGIIASRLVNLRPKAGSRISNFPNSPMMFQKARQFTFLASVLCDCVGGWFRHLPTPATTEPISIRPRFGDLSNFHLLFSCGMSLNMIPRFRLGVK